MKRCLCVFCVSVIWIMALAQSQQGRVKTVGRPGKPGVVLGGVTVRVSGDVNTVVSNTEGSFSFPVSGRLFRFSRISKKGYELADRDFIRYDFEYSPNAPIIVAMVSKEELEHERKVIEESIKDKLSDRFQKENAVLERKLERTQISNEECNKQLLALHEKYDNLDTLVSILSDRYVRTDYDNIDSIRLLINSYIEKGELERAQNAILSKGSINERMKDLEETRKQKEKIRKLELQVQIAEERKQKDLAKDLYQLYEIARNQQRYDSAYIYLEQRYYTDTTQVQYLTDIAQSYFNIEVFPIEERKDWEMKHETYLLKLYNLQHIQNASSLHGIDLFELEFLEEKIGAFYFFSKNYEKAMEFYKKMLQARIDEKRASKYSPLEWIGRLYRIQEDYAHALEAFQEAFCYLKKERSAIVNQEAYIDECYRARLNIAQTYELMGNVESALKEYMSIEKNYELPNDSNILYKRRIYNLYFIQEFIAKNLLDRGKSKDAINYYGKAIKNAERYFFLTNETRAIYPIISLLKQQQEVFALRGEYKQMLACARKNLDYAQLYVKRLPSAYSRLLYAEVLCLMADANAKMGNLSTTEQELIECLKKGEFASNIFKERYKQLTYNIYMTFATMYYKQGLYKEALNAVNKSISILPTMPQAYLCKRDILKAIGEKEELRIVEEKLYEHGKRDVGQTS